MELPTPSAPPRLAAALWAELLPLLFLPLACHRASPLPRVGPTPDHGTLTPTLQLLHPAGRSIEFHGRPVDLALSPDGRTAYVKSDTSLFVLDLTVGTTREELKYPDKLGASLHGIALSPDGRHLYVTLAQSILAEYTVRRDGTVSAPRLIPVRVKKQGESYPNGLAVSADGRTAYVCLSCNNCLAVVDLPSARVTAAIPTGMAPYGVAVAPDGSTAYVTNWGGRRPTPADHTNTSAGSQVVTDSRGIAATGSVSVLKLRTFEEAVEIPTGLHPSALLLSTDCKTLYVANANSDTVSVIDTATHAVTHTLNVRPDVNLPFGSAPNALALSSDAKTLYVALGGNDAVAVVDLDGSGGGKVSGFVPAAWYPGALALHDDNHLIIANVKGTGSRDPAQKGKYSTRYGAWGSITDVELPDVPTLRQYTTQVLSDALVPQALKAIDLASAPGRPTPVPAHPGQASVFRHVIYVIKENRTYDQVLGDVGRGNSDPSLCIYGDRVTPNQHALARQFALLDNYYCNGILSPDGHHWATEGVTTDYLEKSFGAWVRSYPSTGDDPLAYAPSGFIWDNALQHGLSFRNYGEFRYDKFEPFAHGGAERTGLLRPPPSTQGTFRPHLGLPAIEPYTCPDFPGYTTEILDTERADIFIRELHEFERTGNFPNLLIVYLPNNHTNGLLPGSRTPDAMVADNDLAVGKIADALSHSRFWQDTCLFVTEDDPQDGFDHVDGHRSPCLVISPYTRRNAVVSHFYNQTSVLHTIELMLGLPPMNQFDASSPPMVDVFQSKSDLTPYLCLPNRVPLDERNPPKAAMSAPARAMAEVSESLKLDLPDEANEDRLNRVLWFAARPHDPYPAQWAGAHGRGLKRLGLRAADVGRDDDD